MDYRNLLLKYIEHVGEEEGITFLNRPKPKFITDEEWAELKRLDAEQLAAMKERAV